MNDQKAFDDSNSDGGVPTGGAATAPDLLDFSEPVQQQQPFGQPPAAPPQQYPGGQYPPQQQQQYGAPPQQYPGSPPQGQFPMQQQQPYGANPHMQQQYNPAQGQAQAYGGY